MSTLSERQQAILNMFWSSGYAARAFDQLCDLLAPAVHDVLTDILSEERVTSPFGIPVVRVADESRPTEGVTVLAVAWIGAISQSGFRRGPDYLSDLDEDLLPITTDLAELYAAGTEFGLDPQAVRAIFNRMKRHRSRKLRLPQAALRLLKAIGFFAKQEEELELPKDLSDALDESDCAFVWANGVGFTLSRESESICHVVRLSRTMMIIETGPDETDALPACHRGWARERVATVVLNGVIAKKARRFSIDSFRMFLSHIDLGTLEPQLIPG